AHGGLIAGHVARVSGSLRVVEEHVLAVIALGKSIYVQRTEAGIVRGKIVENQLRGESVPGAKLRHEDVNALAQDGFEVAVGDASAPVCGEEIGVGLIITAGFYA